MVTGSSPVWPTKIPRSLLTTTFMVSMITCPRYLVLGAIGEHSSCGRPAIHEIVFTRKNKGDREILGVVLWVCPECLPIYLDNGWVKMETILKEQQYEP